MHSLAAATSSVPPAMRLFAVDWKELRPGFLDPRGRGCVRSPSRGERAPRGYHSSTLVQRGDERRGKGLFPGSRVHCCVLRASSPLRDFQEVPPAEVHRWAATTVPKEAEAVLIAGNGLRAVGVINALEDTLSRPVLTANQVTFWRALKRVERRPQVTQFGRLFRAAQQ